MKKKKKPQIKMAIPKIKKKPKLTVDIEEKEDPTEAESEGDLPEEEPEVGLEKSNSREEDF